MGQGLLIVGFITRRAGQLLPHLPVSLSVRRAYTDVGSLLNAGRHKVVGTRVTRKHLNPNQGFVPPRQHLDRGHQRRANAGADDVRQPLLHVEGRFDSPNGARFILDAEEQNATGGIGKCYDTSQHIDGRRKVTLEFQRFALVLPE